MRESKLDWTEDYPHENGNYMNVCSKCEQQFFGHKRRTVCKKCSDAILTPTTMNREETFTEYLRSAKNEFVNKVNAMNLCAAERVVMEDIIIAFDQCRDELTKLSTPPQAIAFGEWLRKEGYEPCTETRWAQFKIGIRCSDYFTESQLYDLFLEWQSKQQNNG